MASEKSWTRQGLVDEIAARFGKDARFHTCSAEGMSPEVLVGFLEQKGKFIASDSGLKVDPSRVCQHD